MRLYGDNKSAINIAHNPVQHDHTKHRLTDICTPFVHTKDQLTDIFTKGLSSSVFQSLVDKTRIDNIHSSA